MALNKLTAFAHSSQIPPPQREKNTISAISVTDQVTNIALYIPTKELFRLFSNGTRPRAAQPQLIINGKKAGSINPDNLIGLKSLLRKGPSEKLDDSFTYVHFNTSKSLDHLLRKAEIESSNPKLRITLLSEACDSDTNSFHAAKGIRFSATCLKLAQDYQRLDFRAQGVIYPRNSRPGINLSKISPYWIDKYLNLIGMDPATGSYLMSLEATRAGFYEFKILSKAGGNTLQVTHPISPGMNEYVKDIYSLFGKGIRSLRFTSTLPEHTADILSLKITELAMDRSLWRFFESLLPSNSIIDRTSEEPLNLSFNYRHSKDIYLAAGKTAFLGKESAKENRYYLDPISGRLVDTSNYHDILSLGNAVALARSSLLSADTSLEFILGADGLNEFRIRLYGESFSKLNSRTMLRGSLDKITGQISSIAIWTDFAPVITINCGQEAGYITANSVDTRLNDAGHSLHLQNDSLMLSDFIESWRDSAQSNHTLAALLGSLGEIY